MRIVENKAKKPARTFAVGAEQVATYIKMGRRRVIGTPWDPYKGPGADARMIRDAMHIASWYNFMRRSWTIEQRMKAYVMVRDIQYGPSAWWYTVLYEGLELTQFKAAMYWAKRHASGEFVDVNLAPETRAAIAELIRKRLRGWKYDKQAMLDHLKFVFFGARAEDSNPLSL